MHIEKYLNELKETWDYTQEELNHIRVLMNLFAIDAIMDSNVEKEIVKDLDNIQKKG